jgi:hypothetical protein
VESIAVSMVGIAAINGKASPQPIAALLHVGDAPDNITAGKALAGDVHDAKQTTGIMDLVVSVAVFVR